MSKIIRCDGCGSDLVRDDAVIHGERANGMLGGRPLPDGEFDWCLDCARIAFTAVHDHVTGVSETFNMRS
jgi:hypothetical protein